VRCAARLAGPRSPVFERAHHQRIGRILASLDAARLRSLGCWFGGGTAIALRRGEYRESLDIDFMVSDLGGYGELRQRLMGAADLRAITRDGCDAFALERAMRADQYGIRGFVLADEVAIKFEVVSQGRMGLQTPGRADVVCGVATLSLLDLAASKLLANADRWRDDSVFSRDAIDLAMLDLPPRQLRPALHKVTAAYGIGVADDMQQALQALRGRSGWLLRCMHSLAITLPPALVQQKLRRLARRMAVVTEPSA